MATVDDTTAPQTLQTLPGDDVRQIMWRFADRYDLHMLVQSARAVARGPVARLVAEGGRNTHEWTEGKAGLFRHFDQSGITGAALEAEQGGMFPGPKNLVFGLVGFELAWVDAGAATSSLASNLAYAPIHEKGTEEQKSYYLGKMAPPADGSEPMRGAFALTEPIPYVGVDTGTLGGRMRVAEWNEDGEPMLQVEKRGRFITNMDTAGYVTAAVDSDDERIKGSCMIILEETDEGSFDRGAPTLKMVHQLSSTRDPIINVKVPASRIIGGYTIQDGVIVPNFGHGEVIEAVFRRTRATVGIMTAAKLLSAVEPVIRYQRGRFRGGSASTEGTSRFELGLQQREDSLHRLIDVWATGEAAASYGFETVRLLDEFDLVEQEANTILDGMGVKNARGRMKALRPVAKEAIEYIELSAQPEDSRDNTRLAELEANVLVKFVLLEAQANVICPGSKLWNTGVGATMMREAISLMGGYGITEDCPGFLMNKWTDAQLEATYEGPEAVQRRQLSLTMTNEVFLAQWKQWTKDMRKIAFRNPGTGACTLATAMQMWQWTLEHLKVARDAKDSKLYNTPRQGVTFPLADALTWLMAARQLILDVLELQEKGPDNPVVAEGLEGTLSFMLDLCHTQASRASGEVGRICAELVFGYNQHPAWGGQNCGCYAEAEVDGLESMIPGLEAVADSKAAVTHPNEPLPCKAGPCVHFDGMEAFTQLRTKLDGCLTGARLAKDRAASALVDVMIPEALDYPQ